MTKKRVKKKQYEMRSDVDLSDLSLYVIQRDGVVDDLLVALQRGTHFFVNWPVELLALLRAVAELETEGSQEIEWKLTLH